METKDWVIMLVPIFLNGMLLFVLQLFAKERAKRHERKNLLKNELLLELYRKIQNLEAGKFEYRFMETFKIPDKEKIDKENVLMDELMVYFRSNYFEFSKYEKHLDALDKLWKKSTKLWDKLSENYSEIQEDMETKNAIKRHHANVMIDYYKVVLDWQRCADTIKMMITKNIR